MRRKNNESGVILPIVIILALALMITGMAFLNMAVMEANLAMREVHKTQAFYLAEAGVEDARFKLGQDWGLVEDYNGGPKESPPIIGALGAGTYNVTIYNTESDNVTGLSSNRRRVNSTGTVKKVSQIVQVIVRKPTGHVIDSVLESGGNIKVKSASVFIDGKVIAVGQIIDEHHRIEPDDPNENPGVDNFSLYEPPLDYFYEIFGVTKKEMKQLAQRSPNTYYDHSIFNVDVENITWVDGQEDLSSFTETGWTGSGILVINGNAKITGGTFNGVIWVIGTLLMIPAGNPNITGSVFVESSTEWTEPDSWTDIAGTPSLIWDPDVISEMLGKIATIPFIEFGSWEQLK